MHLVCLPTLIPTFGGEVSPLHWSLPAQVPNSPTHDPAVGPRVHLAGEEQSVAPQVVLHGPLQGFLKTQTSPSGPPCSPSSNTTNNCAWVPLPPEQLEARLPGRLAEPPCESEKERVGNQLQLAGISLSIVPFSNLHVIRTYYMISLAPHKHGYQLPLSLEKMSHDTFMSLSTKNERGISHQDRVSKDEL